MTETPSPSPPLTAAALHEAANLYASIGASQLARDIRKIADRQRGRAVEGDEPIDDTNYTATEFDPDINALAQNDPEVSAAFNRTIEAVAPQLTTLPDGTGDKKIIRNGTEPDAAV